MGNMAGMLTSAMEQLQLFSPCLLRVWWPWTLEEQAKTLSYRATLFQWGFLRIFSINKCVQR